MKKRLDQKVAIITGAGQGIGRASAVRFADEGATVVVNDIDAESAEATAESIRSAGGRAIARPADVTSYDAVRELVDGVDRELGKIDVLFNNAGGALPTPTHELSIEDYQQIIRLNLDAVFYGTHCALKVMMRQRSGCILMTSSGAGIGAVAGLAAYGAAKAGVISFARSIATEYGHLGIRANVVSPGPMATPSFMAWLETIPGGREKFEAQVPAGRLGAALDIADAALFLASDEASFVNGVVLPVDGGIHSRYASPEFREDAG